MRVGNNIHLGAGEVTPEEWRRIADRLRYVDAEGVLHEPWRVTTRLPREIILPRGAWAYLPDHIEYEDQRVCPKIPRFDFKLQLDAKLPDGRSFERQEECVDAMFFEEQGLIHRMPGSGKTQIALAFAARCETSTLVVVHTEDILQQWISYAKEAIPDADIGIIRGKEQVFGHITIATVQTLHRILTEMKARERVEYMSTWGCFVLDEGHHGAADTFAYVTNCSPARYRFAFTASPTRADKRHPYLKSLFGPTIHELEFKSKVPVKVIPVKTGYYYGYRGRWDWGNLLRDMITNDERNAKIARRVARNIRDGHSTLVLSRRIEHLEQIKDHLWLEFQGDEGYLQRVAILAAGKVKGDKRKRILDNFKSGKILCVLATQLADEALDVTRISRLHLTHPGKHDGRLMQQVGRALREHEGKENAIVYDYVDAKVWPLRRQWMERKQAYGKMKIPIKKRKWRATASDR